MHFELGILCIFNVLAANSFEVFSINDGYRGFVEEIESKSIEPRLDIIERWIEQKVDHFEENDTRTWKMRYFQDVHFWKPDGPVYLFINGEAPASPSFLTTGLVYELAKETEGAMFLSEHRYYGKSQPLNRSHFNAEDMKFLSVAQALADNAVLLRTIKDKIPFKNSKIVVVGGSYAGNLAAWMKLVYPDVVNAAVSSSAPVLAKKNFYEYLEVVGNDYKKFGTSDCIEKIELMFLRYSLLFLTEKGTEQVKKEMNICENTDMNRLENIQLFFLSQTTTFMSNAQYGTTEAIKNHCSKLNNTKDIQLQSEKKYYWRKDEDCYDYDFDKTVQEYKEDKNNAMLCWIYQTCTEFGYFQTSTSSNHPFGNNIPLDWYVKFCTALFGVEFDENRVEEGVKKINQIYKGKSLNVTEVLFVNGEMDPWSSLGITKDGSLDPPVMYIPKSSHCRDLFSNEPGDSEELKQARAHVKDQIKAWIGITDNLENEGNASSVTTEYV